MIILFSILIRHYRRSTANWTTCSGWSPPKLVVSAAGPAGSSGLLAIAVGFAFTELVKSNFGKQSFTFSFGGKGFDLSEHS